jgi:hypothetical protein
MEDGCEPLYDACNDNADVYQCLDQVSNRLPERLL